MNKRQAGVLLHPTSLPNEEGEPGKLNEQAWRFLDWMEASGLSIWQMLPLGHPHEDRSPYQAVSAFALNPALLPDDWQALCDEGEFMAYLHNPPHWLEDYALFMTIRKENHLSSWIEWPHALKARDPEALLDFAEKHQAAIQVLKRQQYVLQKVWRNLKEVANSKGIQLFGDMPIFVAFDSADVWANPDQFKLDEKLNPTVVTGVPPDYFSKTGQRWGNPHYDWEAMRADHFSWWRKRVATALEDFDLVRIDHFRGFEAAWEIDASEETAINGRWVETPGEALLDALHEDFPSMPLIAEDLGIITEGVIALKNRYHLPGMSVLQFGFNGLPDNPHSLDEQVENSVTYTGTHDNDTTLGWYESLDPGTEYWVREQLASRVGAKLEALELPRQMPWPLIVAALETVAQRVVVPMQDWLVLGSEHRMNIPGVPDGNWMWQFQWSQVPEDLERDIRVLVEDTDRLPNE